VGLNSTVRGEKGAQKKWGGWAESYLSLRTDVMLQGGEAKTVGKHECESLSMIKRLTEAQYANTDARGN